MVHAIVTHTDIDGVAAGALYIYLNDISEYRVFFTEPFLLHRALDKVASAYYEKVVVLDIGINPREYSEVKEYIALLRKHEIPVTWFDHHIWEQKWINDMEKLGVELYIDLSMCTTGVVAKYVKPVKKVIDRYFVENLVKGVCAGDLWKFDHWLGGFYIRVVRRKDKDSWRKTVLKTLASGTLWSNIFDERIEEHINNELRYLSQNLQIVVKNVNGLKLSVVRSLEVVENSFLASYIIGRHDADVVILVSEDGKLSFRSRDVDVRNIAHSLGGGGHRHAAGAKIEIPWWIRALSRIKRDFLLHYVANLVVQKLTYRW